jgi:DNA-binding transcriptional MerR regulator
MKEITLDIGEVVKLSGYSASALRFYEQKGLIKSVGRKGLRRQYDSKVLDTLSLVSLGRAANLTLDEVAAMFDEKGHLCVDRARLSAKVSEIDQQIARLKATRDGLLHVVQCPSEQHVECPKFRQLMRVAIKL